MQILDGKLVAAERRALLKAKLETYSKRHGRTPQLCVVLVGENPASQVYVRNKVKACASVGLRSLLIELPATVSQANLLKKIDDLNQDPDVDGILVQLPLPGSLNEEEINSRLSPLKDADGFTYISLGHLFAGRPIVAPCTPQGVMTLLSHYKIPVAGKHAVVVGRSNIVGKPMAQLLLMHDATVSICHSKTVNLREFTRMGDIVVAAAGKREFLGRDDFKKGAVIIDVGIHGSGGAQKIAGDVRWDEIQDWASAATPVPGGVGPMTIACLLENTLKLAEFRSQA